MSDELVHLDLVDGVATITLDSPANRNALSQRLLGDLRRHVTSAIADPAARVIVLTGSGTVFCSGADLKEQREANVQGAGSVQPLALSDILTAIWESPKPVVARVNGPARAGGIGLVAVCDLAVAAESATFAVSEVRIGVIPAIISVVLLPKVGLSKAMELFLCAEPFSAAEGVAIGLLNASAPAEALDATVARYVASLSKGAPKALAGAKRLVRDVPGMPLAEAFAETSRRSAEFFASDEAREGMQAFLEKRSPSWVRARE